MHFKLEIVSALAILAAAVDAQQALWGQCGGIGYTGQTTCVAGAVCVKNNDYYSQCIPGTATSSSSTTTRISTTTTSTSPAPTSGSTFTNPIKTQNGSDPHMVYHDGYYYLTATTWSNIQVARARTINELKTAKFEVVWRDTTASRCCNIWAPEMHRIDGRWYIYYTAGPSGDQYSTTQKTWVIQGGTNHPMEPYTFLSEVNVGIPNLDSSVYKIGNKNYYLTSAWPSGGQSVYIAELLSPGRVGPITKISQPTLSWETQKWAVNEGPIGLTGPTGRHFIFFSSSACASSYYNLGYLELTPGADPLQASSWKKNPNVQFSSGNGMFGPGHNGFFKSPSGKEDWIVYHANTSEAGTCDGNRRTEVQKVNWNSDGTPNLGRPVGENVPIAEPV